MDGKLLLDSQVLKSLRKKRGLSQSAMAEKSMSAGAPVSLATIKRAELGKPILYRTATSIAAFFDVEITDITLDSAENESSVSDNTSLDSVVSNRAGNIVGREFELLQLEQALSVIKHSQLGRVIYIRGVTGIGKSYLINAFESKVNSEATSYISVKLNSDVSNDWASSLKPLLALLLDLPNDVDFDRDPISFVALLKKKGLDQQDIFHLCTMLSVAMPPELENESEAMSYFSQNESENKLLLRLIKEYKKALVVAVEDIHWASDKLLLTLRYITANIVNLPVLLLLTSRIENDPIDAIWRSSILNTPFNTMDLPPLNNVDATALTKTLQSFDAEYTEQCIKLSGGNPLFLQQLLLNYPQSLGGTPATVSELAAARLRGLGDHDRLLLSAASLIGDTFSLDVLCFLLELDTCDCGPLVSAFFITPIDEDEYQFCHVLIRHGVADSIDDEQKNKWHKRLADWFSDKNKVSYAYHLSQTRNHDAQSVLIDAAEKFIDQYNYADALSVIDRALTLDDSRENLFKLLITKGDLLHRLDLSEKSINYFQQAQKIAETIPEKVISGVGLAHALAVIGRLALAEKILAETNAYEFDAGELKLTAKVDFIGSSLQVLGSQLDGSFVADDVDLSYLNNNDLVMPPEAKESKGSKNLPSVKVGILHSLTGFMKELEEGVLRTTLMAIGEINNSGGLLGHYLVPEIVDCQSSDEGFEQAANSLINDPDIVTFFGTSTSSSRRRVKPIIEKHNHLLVYPFHYEGLESSSNIAYMGPAPSQQALPAVDWMYKNGSRKFYLLGSDYVYPRVTNKLIRARLDDLPGASVVAEAYTPLGGTDFDAIIRDIKSKDIDGIILTLVGFEPNKSFLAQLHQMGVSIQTLPTLSLVLSEENLPFIPVEHIQGIYTLFSYFQNIDSPINEEFVRKFKHIFGSNKRIGGYMESAYSGVHVWAKGVQKAGEFSPLKILESMKGVSHYAPGGIAYLDETNNHVWRHARLAQVGEDGEYHVKWSSENPIQPDPYPLKEKKMDWDQVLETVYEAMGDKWENLDDEIRTS